MNCFHLYRVMYWIEGGNSNAIIYKAALDGSDIISIATNVNDSQDLSVDVVEHRVYWNAVSGAVYQILSAAEDGSDVTTVFDSGSFHSASIAVFEDYIYSAKETTQFIFRVDKYTRQSELSLVVCANVAYSYKTIFYFTYTCTYIHKDFTRNLNIFALISETMKFTLNNLSVKHYTVYMKIDPYSNFKCNISPKNKGLLANFINKPCHMVQYSCNATNQNYINFT